MRHSEFSWLSRLFVLALVASAFLTALYNVARGTVVHPRAFSIVLAGLICFLVGKLSLIARGRWVTFGTGRMSERMANVYRIGYWLMVVGALVAFG